MADIEEVGDKLVGIAIGAVYPGGTGQPSVGACPVIAYQGWPNPQTLDIDMAAGKVHVSVFPRPGDTITSILMGDAEWAETSNDGTTGISSREVRRQSKHFQITIWAPTPALRKVIAKAVNLALALASRFTMDDGSQTILTYVNETQLDTQQKVSVYRRDLFYAANYAIVEADPEFTILQTETNITLEIGEGLAGPTITVTNP